MTRDEVISVARSIASAPPNTAYISRASSQHVRDIMAQLLAILDESEQALKEIAAAARFEQEHPSELRDTAFSLIEKRARYAKNS